MEIVTTDIFGEESSKVTSSLMTLAQINSMIGDYEKCLSISEKFRDIGVDEIVCLVDFGVDLDSILATIEKLAKIHNHLNR